MIEGALVVLHLVQFTGPDNQRIELNAETVVTVRRPRHNEHFGPGIHCIISTSDGKFVGVVEACETVLERLAR